MEINNMSLDVILDNLPYIVYRYMSPSALHGNEISQSFHRNYNET